MASKNGMVPFTCGKCRVQVEINVAGFEPKTIVTQSVACPNNHKTIVKVRGGKIIDIDTRETGDIHEYVDVPPHLKEIIQEAYVCFGEGIPKAGTCAVRLVLDDFLFELGCTAQEVYNKVKQLESKCKSDLDFEKKWRIICRRIAIFEAVARLGGYHAHAQEHKITEVSPSEFSNYLYTIEAAVKDFWPKKSGEDASRIV